MPRIKPPLVTGRLSDVLAPAGIVRGNPTIAAVSAASLTVTVFFIMQLLTAMDEVVMLSPDADFRFVDVIEDIRESPPEVMERKVEKPQEVEAPPPEIDVPDVQTPRPSTETLGLSLAPALLNKDQISLNAADFGAQEDGDYVPLVRVQPTYPHRAKQRRVEGYVLVELSVDADGTVPADSILVLDADPPARHPGIKAQSSAGIRLAGQTGCKTAPSGKSRGPCGARVCLSLVTPGLADR